MISSETCSCAPFIHEVHCGPREAGTALDNSLVDLGAIEPLAAKVGQQRGVDVQHGALVRPHQLLWDELHRNVLNQST